MPYIGDIEVDYHRNGMSGEPFWTCRFTFEGSDTQGPQAFVAVLPVLEVPDESEVEHRLVWGRCYVLRVRDLIDGGGMMYWRGDYFEATLQDAIKRAREIWFDRSVSSTAMPIRVPAYDVQEVPA